MFGFGTKCVKCEGGSFKLQEIEAQGARYKLYAIQCISCSTAFGITEYYDAGNLLKKQEKDIEGLKRQLSDIQGYVHQIAQALARR